MDNEEEKNLKESEKQKKLSEEEKREKEKKQKELIRLKCLAYKIPALTGLSFKIFLNPILKFSDKAKKDKSQRTNILKSALVILLIHEITHLLKIYPVQNIIYLGRKLLKILIINKQNQLMK